MGEPGPAPEEHRQRKLPAGRLTFLFTDIEGSTQLFRELSHGYVAVLDRQRAIIRAAVADQGGVEISTSGDEVFAVFTGADAAAAASEQAQRELGAQQWQTPRPVRVRMGLHTGEAAPFGGDYVSLVVHQAARVAAAANGGQVLLSDATAAELSTHTSRALGSFHLRDFPQVERLHQLLVAGIPDRFPAPRTRSAALSHLPGRVSSFVGREGEIDALCADLAQGRMVTLVGVGGTGKTRLAIEAAERLAGLTEGGAHLVELAPVSEPWAVPAAVAAAMGMTLPASVAGVEALVAQVGGLEALLVLDNCEHLLEPVAELADLLLRRTRLRLLATSRAPLRIEGERVISVAPLPSVDAAALLVARARAAGAALPDDDATRAEAHEVARLLDGIPLALELVAGRLAEVPLAEVRQALAAGQADLGSRRGGDPRQRSLASTIAWSWDLLDPAAQAAWRRLAVLRNGADPELAAEVVAFGALTEAAAATAVEQLVEHSVLSTVSGSPGRFRLLEPLREHALQRLAADEAEATLGQLRRSLAGRLPLEGTAVVPLMAHHRDDLIAAVQHRPLDPGSLALARATAYATIFGILGDEGLRLAEDVVADSEVPPPAALSRALAGAHRHLGRLERARATVVAALERAVSTHERGQLESALGDVEFYAGRAAEARQHQKRALSVLAQPGSASAAFITMRLAELHLALGEPREALALLRRIESALVGDHAHCVLLHDLAQACIHLGELAEADDLHRRLQAQGDAGNREALLCAHMVAAELADVRGEVTAGLVATSVLLEAAHGEARPLDIVWHSTLRSRALLAAGDPARGEAAHHLERALRAALAMTGGPSPQLTTVLAVPAAAWPEDPVSREAWGLAQAWAPTFGMLWTHRDLRVAAHRHGPVEPASAVTVQQVENLITALRG